MSELVTAEKDTLDIDGMFDAIDTAYARAKALHDAGCCHESEWSCSYCERGLIAERGADL